MKNTINLIARDLNYINNYYNLEFRDKKFAYYDYENISEMCLYNNRSAYCYLIYDCRRNNFIVAQSTIYLASNKIVIKSFEEVLFLIPELGWNFITK